MPAWGSGARDFSLSRDEAYPNGKYGAAKQSHGCDSSTCECVALWMGGSDRRLHTYLAFAKRGPRICQTGVFAHPTEPQTPCDWLKTNRI